jgi:hypothetical protein
MLQSPKGLPKYDLKNNPAPWFAGVQDRYFNAAEPEKACQKYDLKTTPQPLVWLSRTGTFNAAGARKGSSQNMI